jgi:branched-chain amino acid transport system ATP-binding protein
VSPIRPLGVGKIFQVLREINRRGTSILLVEQNARMALSVAKRGYVLEEGKVSLEGLATDLLREEKVRQAYLGEEAAS